MKLHYSNDNDDDFMDNQMQPNNQNFENEYIINNNDTLICYQSPDIESSYESSTSLLNSSDENDYYDKSQTDDEMDQKDSINNQQHKPKINVPDDCIKNDEFMHYHVLSLDFATNCNPDNIPNIMVNMIKRKLDNPKNATEWKHPITGMVYNWQDYFVVVK